MYTKADVNNMYYVVIGVIHVPVTETSRVISNLLASYVNYLSNPSMI